MNNKELVAFCEDKAGTPYVMGTNGKVFTKAMYDDLVKRNPGGWFIAARRAAIKEWIGKITTDCHGLIEWFIRECTGESYDVTADAAYNAATEKGNITDMPELPGICVRYPGHVGVYIGDGLVVEARGFDYGVCITELAKRPWTRWYKHPKIEYEEETMKITKGMNTEQIQKILSAGGYIECEQGTYNIMAPLILSSNTRLNLGKAVFRQGAAINHIFVTQTAPDTTGYNGAHDIEIYGGTIEGMGKYGTKLNLITTYHARNIYIHGITLQDVVGFHHIELNASSCVTIENCTFTGYNVLEGDSDFRECVQLDAAVESALVLHPLGSKCYDGTMCENIIIRNCRFEKSASRPAPSNCIGNHCQVTAGKHQNILIEGNTFTGGNQNNPHGICINLVGMENVQVRGNSISGFGRGVRVYSYDKSYTVDGEKVAATGEDGTCSNVQITRNEISDPTGTYVSSGIWVTAKNGRHESIVIRDNSIEKSGKMKYAVDMNYCDGGYVVDNETEGVVKIGKTCNGVYEKGEV